MNATYDKDTKTLSVILTDDEHNAFQRVKKVLTLRAVEAQLETWLFAQARELSSKNLAIIRAQLERANAVELDSVKSALGIL